MKRGLVIVLFVLFLLGCTTPVQDRSFVCDTPYIQVGNSCCLDVDSNSICDIDEVSDKPVIDLQLPVVVDDSCGQTSFKVVNVCSNGALVKYVLDVGDVDIDSFEAVVYKNAEAFGEEVAITQTVAGGGANERLAGAVDLGFGIYIKAEFFSNPCGISGAYGPGFPNTLDGC
ncbi:MAG: hypothetical protein AABW49_00135 [Nanoarchaeota archaeon]